MSVSKKTLENSLKNLEARKRDLEGKIAALNNQIGQLNREYLMILGSIENTRSILGSIVVNAAKKKN